MVQSYVEFLRERLKALDTAIGFLDFLRSNARRSLSDQTFQSTLYLQILSSSGPAYNAKKAQRGNA